MAPRRKKRLPDYREKQKILYIKQTPPEQLLEIADRLLEQGRFSEAYDYIERSGDSKRLEKFMDGALKRGDFFNFDRAARKLDIEVTPELWEQLGDNAKTAEFFVYAVQAYRRAGSRVKAEEVIRANSDFFGPAIEMEREKALLRGKIETNEGPAGVEQRQPAESAEGAAPAKAHQKTKKKKKKKRKRK